ncbi:MAG: hypothetical protein VZQ78_11060, partial [Prevotella sp.]|nr:hypothetical protein [Prevotella sp.]
MRRRLFIGQDMFQSARDDRRVNNLLIIRQRELFNGLCFLPEGNPPVSLTVFFIISFGIKLIVNILRKAVSRGIQLIVSARLLSLTMIPAEPVCGSGCLAGFLITFSFCMDRFSLKCRDIDHTGWMPVLFIIFSLGFIDVFFAISALQ